MLLDQIGLTSPVVQAPMATLSRHELATAVSESGGLGTIAVIGADQIAAELAAARALTGAPMAIGVLLTLARRDWFAAAAQADVVITFWGKPRRHVPGLWLHQCGSVREAQAAHRAGADGVIVQGLEAGGHVRGSTPAIELLAHIRAGLPSGYPLMLAGGIADRDDVELALAAGADAAVAGTRFLASTESRAHPLYKQALTAGERTILTDLFGFGWPAPHRVLQNAATRHWLRDGTSTPSLIGAINRMSALGSRHVPAAMRGLLGRRQHPTGRLLTPLAATDDGPDGLLAAGPLYAGETVARIGDIRPAGELVRALTP